LIISAGRRRSPTQRRRNGRPQTAAAQYAAAEATWKQDEDEQTALDKRVHEIQDGTVIAKPFDDRITAVKDDLSKSEERELESCKDLTFVRKFDPWQQNELSVTFSKERIGEYQFGTVDRVIFFANGGAATECKDRLQKNLGEAVILHQRQLQDITRERDAAVDEFRRSKAEEVAPLLKKYNDLSGQMRPLQQVLAELKNRAIQEQILGKPLPNERVVNGTEKQIEPTDWARVVQTNLTRLGAVAIMFFLVGILVPQYRYNIRMASFYDARADSVRLADKVQDLSEIATVMTPNIDFGKAPATPWEQIVEVIKAAKR
jgi:hypothetical protein